MDSVEFVRNCESGTQDSAEARLRREAALVCTYAMYHKAPPIEAPEPQVGLRNICMTNPQMLKRVPRHAGNS